MTNKPDINIKETASKILESKGKLSENQYFKKLEAFVSTLSKEPVSDSGFPFNLDAAKILFQGIGLGIAIIDNEFKIAFCNPSMAKALCKTLENIEGEKCYEVFQCKDDVCHFCPAKKASQTGKTKDVEVIVNCEDNEGQWLRILSIPLIENKKVYGFLDVVHNISEKKATEMQLTREKEYIKLIAETSPAGIVHLSKQGEIKYANQMAEKILGLTKNEILIRKYNSPEWEITDFEGNPFPDKELPFEQVKEKMKPVNDIRHTIKVGKDNWRYLSVNASPVINENGKFNGMVASLDDISDKIKVAKKLEEENHFRKAIIQNAAEGLCVCKEIPDFPYVKFTHWNDRMTGITGYSMDEINEKGWYQSLYPDPYIQQKAIERMAKMREGEDIIREEWEIAAKSGEKRIITISSTILKLKGDATHVMALIEDVTDHRNAMQALLESEEKYKQLFEYSPNSVTYSDINGNIIDCNLTILEAHKYRSKEEVIGRNVMEFIAPEYLEKAKTNFEKLIRNEKREDSKYRFLKSDGTTFPVELSAKIVKDFQGKPVGIISISQDLTEKNIAKEQLQQAADIFNHIPSGIFIYHLEDINDDTTLKMVAVNSAAAKLIGVKCGDMLEKTLDQNFPYLREKHIPQQYAQVIRQQKPIEIEDIYYKDDRVDGAFEVWVFPLPGNKVGVAFNNITEKKKNEILVKKSEQRYKLLADNASDMISLHDAQGHFTYCSPASKDILGFEPDELIGKGAWEFHHPDDIAQIKEHFEKTKQRKSQPPLQYRFKKKDGTFAWFETISETIYDEKSDSFNVTLAVSRDVSDKIETQKQLQRADDIFHNIPVGLHIYKLEDPADDKTLRMVSANPASELLTGVKVKDVLGKKLDENFPGFRKNGIPQLYAEVVRKQQVKTIEDIYYTDERVIAGAFAVTAFPLPDNMVAAAFENITDRKRAQQEIKISQERLLRAEKVARSGNWEFHLNQNKVIASQGARDLYGVKEESVSIPQAQLFPLKEYRFMMDKALKDLIVKGTPYDLEFKVKRASDGKILDLHSIAEYDKDRNLVFGIIHDITDRKKAEEKIIESEKRYRTLFTNSNDAIAIFKDFKLIDCNQKNLDMFGYSMEEVLGKHPAEFSPQVQKDDEVSFKKAEETFKQVLSGKQQYIIWEHEKKNGEPLHTQISLSQVIIDGEHLLFSILRDITDQVIYERKLKNLNEELEQKVAERTQEISQVNEELTASNEELQAVNEELQSTNEDMAKQTIKLEKTLEELKNTQKQLVQSEKMASLGVLTAGLAHEINNPVNFINSGISGLSNIIDDLKQAIKSLQKITCIDDQKVFFEKINKLNEEAGLDKMIEGFEKLTKNIQTGVNRTTEIITSLRSFTRMDQEKLGKANIHDCINDTLVVLSNEIKNKIEVKRQFDDIPDILCYHALLNQAFMNIIANAIQSVNETGTITIITKLVSTDEKMLSVGNLQKAVNQVVEIRIKDTGKGIPAKVKDKIFEPFYTTKPVGKGTGLGLSITYGIIEKHNGEIFVNSKVGKGSIFIIRLPVLN